MNIILTLLCWYAVTITAAKQFPNTILLARGNKPGPSQASKPSAKRQRESPNPKSTPNSPSPSAKKQRTSPGNTSSPKSPSSPASSKSKGSKEQRNPRSDPKLPKSKSASPHSGDTKSPSSARSKSQSKVPSSGKQRGSSSPSTSHSRSQSRISSPYKQRSSRSPSPSTSRSGASSARSSSPDIRRPAERHFSHSPDPGYQGGLVMSPSNSASSMDVGSVKTKADGPARLQGHSPGPHTIPSGSRQTFKSWNSDGAYSRASVSPSRVDHDNPPRVNNIIKGKRVYTTLDTRRGGSGYINTEGRRGFRHTSVGPGQVVRVKAKGKDDRLARGDTRAIAKAQLNGPGIIESESYMDHRYPGSASDSESSSSSG